MNKKKANDIMNSLYECYPDACCELNYNTPFQLLIATVLSAQTTDKKVNAVTSRMFQRYNTPYDFAGVKQEDLEKEIREIGLYKNKSKNIIALSKTLIEDYCGEVPKEKEELMKLAGVGRKTANVVVSNAFGEPAIAVDTHVFRVSNRIGLADSPNVENTEEQLMKVIPKENWTKAHHTIIFHGRRTCKAIKPNCGECVVKNNCKYFKKLK
jgi:endonuclease-3